jgi:hypothetical protein
MDGLTSANPLEPREPRRCEGHEADLAPPPPSLPHGGSFGSIESLAQPESAAFDVVAEADRFRVVNAAGRTVVVCRDERSAGEYAALLREAHAVGYKQGYRAGRAAR